MKHNDDGQLAEEKVTEFLKTKRYKILERNWKTKACEIDIVAEKDGCIYFAEVKYRASASQGSGFEYITARKQMDMAFAATMWIAMHDEYDEYCLSAAEVSGPDFEINFIEDI